MLVPDSLADGFFRPDQHSGFLSKLACALRPRNEEILPYGLKCVFAGARGNRSPKDINTSASSRWLEVVATELGRSEVGNRGAAVPEPDAWLTCIEGPEVEVVYAPVCG
jgi:hypothetical protein